MGITAFLATALGWYFVIMGFFMLFRQHQLIRGISEITQNYGLLLLSAIITLIVGILMVITHNIWVLDWPLIITVIAWLTLIGGIYRLFFPDTARRMVEKCMDKPQHFRFGGLVTLILGIFLLYMVNFIIGF